MREAGPASGQRAGNSDFVNGSNARDGSNTAGGKGSGAGGQLTARGGERGGGGMGDLLRVLGAQVQFGTWNVRQPLC